MADFVGWFALVYFDLLWQMSKNWVQSSGWTGLNDSRSFSSGPCLSRFRVYGDERNDWEDSL